jgi:hypothetical protein
MSIRWDSTWKEYQPQHAKEKAAMYQRQQKKKKKTVAAVPSDVYVTVQKVTVE